MTRRIVAALIVLSWLASLGWLAARRLASRRAGTTEAEAVQLAPGSSFFSVQLGGRQIGTAGITYDTLGKGFRIAEVVALDLASPTGRVRRDVLRSEAQLSSNLDLVSLQTRWSENGRTRIITSEPPGGVTLPRVMSIRLAAAGLHEGATVEGLALDPVRSGPTFITSRTGRDTLLLVSDSAVQDRAGKWRPVMASAMRSWPIVTRDVGPASISWVDQKGRLVREEEAYGVTLERSPFEVNYTEYQRAVKQGTAIPPASLPGSRRLVDGRDRPDTLAEEVVVVVGRAGRPAWPGAASGFAGGRQTVTGDTVRIARLGSPGADSTPPTRLRNIGPITRNDSVALQQALQSALRGGDAAGDTVRHLVRWVARAVQYVDTATGATGNLTVARTRRGGLEDRIELLVALCRLAGIPARPVAGVDLSRPDLPAHGWVEVWRNGWLAVDPMYGDVPASAYLLRVTEGNAARPLALVPLIGSLRTTLVVPDPGPRRR